MITAAKFFVGKLLAVRALVVAQPLPAATLQAQEVEPGFKSRGNGHDLTGWDGRANRWSVEQGASAAGPEDRVQEYPHQVAELRVK